MKNILFVFLLISTVLFGQKNDTKWNAVIGLENEGKIKSANEIVSKIYKKAINKRDEAEMIRCFFYQSKYLLILDENAQNKILNNLKTDLNRVSVPSKSILNLVYAKCLADYYNKNNYKINQRTNTGELDNNFLTWTERNFSAQTQLALNNSLENETILKNTPLTKYESIFDFSTLEKFKTLSVLDYAIDENITIQSQKIHQWEIQKSDFSPFKKDLLGKSDAFIKLNFDSIKNIDLKSTLKLYQKQEINTPTAQNVWKRIQFSKKFLLEEDQEYINALEILQKNTNDILLIQNIQLEKASFFSQNASKQTYPDYNIKAVSILDSIIKNNTDSNAYKLAIQKKETILYKDLDVQLQKYIYSKVKLIK